MQLFHGDCLNVMRDLDENSVDAVVTDPPYGLKFMGKKWDHNVPAVEVWQEVLRILKPGGHLLSFGGTRTYHRLVCNIEDAGFDIRDTVCWVYGSGFPKSLNVSKAIDKAAGAEISADGYIPNNLDSTHGKGWGGGHKTKDAVHATPSAKQWDGWGTNLKPAHENVILAQKPNPSLTISDIGCKVLVDHFQLLSGVGLCQSKALPASSATENSKQKELKSKGEGVSSVVDLAQASSKGVACKKSASSVEKSSTSQCLKSNKDTASSAAENAKLAGKPKTILERVILTGKEADLCVLMDTLPLELPMVNIDLNTMSSWKTCLVGLWKLMNSATTGTAIEAIIDLRILNSLLCQAISENTTRVKSSSTSGELLSACVVENAFSVANQKWLFIQEHSVPENASVNFVPAHEPIVLARKPLSEKTVAENVLKWGTGAINIDGCRIGTELVKSGKGQLGKKGIYGVMERHQESAGVAIGRFPANFIWSHHPECVQVGVKKVKSSARQGDPRPAGFGDVGVKGSYQSQPSQLTDADGLETVKDWDCHPDCPSQLFPGARSSGHYDRGSVEQGDKEGPASIPIDGNTGSTYEDAGSAARFFYCCKASKADRGIGNQHPTVKPTDLMRYLCKLVTPPGGVVLDPFMGSGTTGVVCVNLDHEFIGIERDRYYFEIAEVRIEMEVKYKP